MREQPGGTGPRQHAGNGVEAPAGSEQEPRPADPPAAGWPPAGGDPSQGGPAAPGPVDRTGRRALLLGGAALVFSLFFFPAGLILGVAALVLGIKARRRARSERGTAPGATGGIVLGSIGLLFAAISVTVAIVLWPELSSYQECLGSANTQTDEAACKGDYTQRLENKFNLPDGSLSKYDDLF